MALDWAKALRQASKIRSAPHHHWSPDCVAADSSGVSASGISASSLPASPAPWALSPATPSSSTSEGDSVTVTNGSNLFATAKKLSVSLSAQPSPQPPSAARATPRRRKALAPVLVQPLASPSTGSCSYGGRGGAAAEDGSPRSASWVGAAVETPRKLGGSAPSFAPNPAALSPLMLPPSAADGAPNPPTVHLPPSHSASSARRAKRPASPVTPVAAAPSPVEMETKLNDWLTNVLAPALAAGGPAGRTASAPRAGLFNGSNLSNKPQPASSASVVPPPAPFPASPVDRLAEQLVGQWRKPQQLPRSPAPPASAPPASAVPQAKAEKPAPFLVRASFPASCSASAPSPFGRLQRNPVASPPPVAQPGNAPLHMLPQTPAQMPKQPVSPPAAHSARGSNDSPEGVSPRPSQLAGDAFCPLAFLAGDLDECDQVKLQVNPQDGAEAEGKLAGDGGIEGCAGLFLSAIHDVRGGEQPVGGKCAEEAESLEELAGRDIDWQSLLAPWEPALGGSSGAPDSDADAASGENGSGDAGAENKGPYDCPSATSQVVATEHSDLAPMWHADVADLCMGVPAWISHEDMDGLHQWDSTQYEVEHLHSAKRQRLA
ncbi:hypothetical protein CLOP_g18291 [Closterium sp. NIES-67]|nr:hypothetical protein CLOP_g18291 [Closterium sp. NIES-67]